MLPLKVVHPEFFAMSEILYKLACGKKVYRKANVNSCSLSNLGVQGYISLGM